MKPLLDWDGVCPTWALDCVLFDYNLEITSHGESMWRWFAAKGVRLFHLFIVIFLAFGWALPWPIAWWAHVVLTIITRLHWRFNNRTCILTSWEQQLLQNEQTEEHEEGWFIKEIAESLTGRRPSTKFTRSLMMYWSWTTAGISILRIALN